MIVILIATISIIVISIYFRSTIMNWKLFKQKATKKLWYDKSSGSTLMPFMWDLHHIGIALLSLFAINFILSFVVPSFSLLVSAFIVHGLFVYNKLFVQGNGIKNKKLKDYKDFVADFFDYAVIWLVVLFHYDLIFAVVALAVIIFIVYYLTTIFDWSTP